MLWNEKKNYFWPFCWEKYKICESSIKEKRCYLFFTPVLKVWNNSLWDFAREAGSGQISSSHFYHRSIFSRFGLTQTKVRNKLCTDKLQKLAFCHQMLRDLEYEVWTVILNWRLWNYLGRFICHVHTFINFHVKDCISIFINFLINFLLNTVILLLFLWLKTWKNIPYFPYIYYTQSHLFQKPAVQNQKK